MPSYLHPGVYIEEVQGTAPIQAAGTAVAAFLGVALMGPVDEPVKCTSFEEFKRRFGDFDPDRSELAYAVQGFFINGGTQCYVGRLAHYTDPDDPLTIVGATANTGTDIESDLGDASPAQVIGTALPTYDLEPGWTLNIDLNNGGVLIATFTATAGARTGVAGTFPTLFAGGETLTLAIDGGATQTIIFTAAASLAADVVAEINAQIVGAQAEVSGGEVRIRSDRRGTGSSVNIIGGTGRATIGLAIGSTSGAGNVSNIDAVTFAEVDTVVTAAITGLVVTQSSGGFIVLTSPTTGPASEIDIKVASSAGLLTAFGLTVGVTTGAASATQHALTVLAANPGEWGNDLSVTLVDNPLFASLGVGLDLYSAVVAASSTIELAHGDGLTAGMILRITDGVNTEHKIIQSIAKVVVGAAIKHVVTTTTAITNGYLVGATTVKSLEFDVQVYKLGALLEVWSQVSMLDTVDNYVETVINDDATGSLIIRVVDENALLGEGADTPQAGTYPLSGGTDESTGIVTADIVGSEAGHTGVHLFDDLDDISLLAIPGYYAAAMVQQVIDYVEARKDLFYVVGPQAGRTREQIETYRQITGGFNTSHAALYWPRITVTDPVGAGSNPQITVDPVGHILGIYARVDNLTPPDGGVWNTPAGFGDQGKIRGALALEAQVRDSDQDVLNPIGVNCLRKFNGQGIVVHGGRTLSNDPNWQYISVRRLFTFVEQSVAKSTRAYVFRNNDFRLWQKLTDLISKFLRGLWEQRAFPGATPAQSYFVKIDETTTTPADVLAGRLIGEIGIAPQRPAEFLIFRFSQYDGSTTVTE
jgi:phage tail sheath protein FI